ASSLAAVVARPRVFTEWQNTCARRVPAASIGTGSAARLCHPTTPRHDAIYFRDETSMADRTKSIPGASDLGTYLKLLGERVRTIRSRRAMSRKALAKHSDVSERYLAQLEGGTGNCSIVLLRRIAHALSVPVAELIDDRPERSVESLLMMQLIDR